MKNNIVVSISAHESELCLVDQCLNYVLLVDPKLIIIHLNSKANFNTQLFKIIVDKIPALAGKVLLNPFSIYIETYPGNVAVVTGLHRAHLTNFTFLEHSRIPFDYFALDASNSLIIRPGLSSWILQDIGDLVGNSPLIDDWNWYSAVKSDNALSSIFQEIKVSQHEGEVFKYSAFKELVYLIYQYEFCEVENLSGGSHRVQYPREEVVFPTAYFASTTRSEVRPPYIFMPWDRNLNWTEEDLRGIWNTDYHSFDKNKFGIKRVARDINDPIRILIGEKFGYRKYLISAVNSLR